MPVLKVEQKTEENKTLCIFFFFFFSFSLYLWVSSISSLPCSPRVSRSLFLIWIAFIFPALWIPFAEAPFVQCASFLRLRLLAGARLLCFRLRFVSEPFDLWCLVPLVSDERCCFMFVRVHYVAFSDSVYWDFDLFLLWFRNFTLKKKKLLFDSAFWKEQTQTVFLIIYVYIFIYILWKFESLCVEFYWIFFIFIFNIAEWYDLKFWFNLSF